MLNSDAYPVPHPQVAARILDGEAVIILGETSEVVVLNEVGSRIWDLADGRRSLADISRQVAAEFEAEPGQIEADIHRFVHSLIQDKMVTLSSTPV